MLYKSEAMEIVFINYPTNRETCENRPLYLVRRLLPKGSVGDPLGEELAAVLKQLDDLMKVLVHQEQLEVGEEMVGDLNAVSFFE